MYGRRDRNGGGSGGFGRGGGGGGGFGRRDSFDKPKPVKLGEEYDVKITDVGAKGDGITKIENFIIFVPHGEKGKEVRVKIKEVARKFAIGEKIGESSGSSDSSSDESETEEVQDSDSGSDEQ